MSGELNDFFKAFTEAADKFCNELEKFAKAVKQCESQSTHARFTAEARNLVTDSGQLSERERGLESEKA